MGCHFFLKLANTNKWDNRINHVYQYLFQICHIEYQNDHLEEIKRLLLWLNWLDVIVVFEMKIFALQVPKMMYLNPQCTAVWYDYVGHNTLHNKFSLSMDIDIILQSQTFSRFPTSDVVMHHSCAEEEPTACVWGSGSPLWIYYSTHLSNLVKSKSVNRQLLALFYALHIPSLCGVVKLEFENWTAGLPKNWPTHSIWGSNSPLLFSWTQWHLAGTQLCNCWLDGCSLFQIFLSTAEWGNHHVWIIECD